MSAFASMPSPLRRRTPEPSVGRGSTPVHSSTPPGYECTVLRTALLLPELSAEGLRDLALDIRRNHRPDRSGVTARLMPWRAVPPRRCLHCAEVWPCYQTKLANLNLASLRT